MKKAAGRKGKIIITSFSFLVIVLIFAGKPLYLQAKYAYYVHEMHHNKGALKGIPIIVYHCIDNNVFGVPEMFVSPKNFEKQMKYLHDSGYTPVTFEQLDQLAKVRKPVMITFDDGYENNFTYAYPILKKYHFRATVFLVTNSINQNRILTTSEINKMKDLISFGSHTIHHRDLTGLSPSSLEQEVRDSRLILERLLNKKVCVFAYPYGKYNLRVMQVVRKYYDFAVGTSNIKNYGIDSDYEIKRVIIDNKMDLKTFAKAVRIEKS